MALVAEDGREVYFELNDNYTISVCSEFVVEWVLPQLTGDRDSISTESARNRLLGFPAKFDIVDIMSDAPDWDGSFSALWLTTKANGPIMSRIGRPT